MLKKLRRIMQLLVMVFSWFNLVQTAQADSFVTDVSSYQGVMNYRANGFTGVIIKAGGGEGASGNYINPYVGAQESQAKKEKIHYGFYYYLGSAFSPEEQARQFYNILGKADAVNPEVPVFVDVEENAWDGNYFKGDEPKRFMDAFYRLSGKRCHVYMNLTMAMGAGGRFDWSDIGNAKLWLALYPSNQNSTYYGQAWANQQFAKIPWFKTVNMWQFGDGDGIDRNRLYGDWSSLTHNDDVSQQVAVRDEIPKTNKKQLWATFQDVYVLDRWHHVNGKWYVTNHDLSIPIEDYHNWIPAEAVILTDRYGHVLRNQSGQGNDGKLEFFILTGMYQVQTQTRHALQLRISNEPVWVESKYARVNSKR
ncbi:hypothetical protein IE337_06080 [Weissella viridescens]|uniref:GH25 family lysozyme n=1 Tax=Weissella viridescens TaxID=1629 RepID=UPI0017461675|nr:GH25 family lysozyme [Weissella viridescens]QOD85769.1 hypothetical protein IE337_06080 [Weissella viridescens]WJI90883.1 GH25 family lysozyme [Weissella viridescens]